MTTHDFSITGVEYPLDIAPVDVAGDFKKLAESLDAILPAYGVSYFHLPVFNNSGLTLSAGTPVYATGSIDSQTTIAKCLAPDTSISEDDLPDSMTKPVLGLIKNNLQNNMPGTVIVAGVMDTVDTTQFEPGDILYIASTGWLTKLRPSGGSGAVGVVALKGNPGIIIVEAKGNGTWGALKAGLA